ncbi:hypothetical protein F5888DRAFT_1296505 [Russula emetica]|nr:hypothetical protein F5888DRAFT_1296505 [Russula emetica]
MSSSPARCPPMQGRDSSTTIPTTDAHQRGVEFLEYSRRRRTQNLPPLALPPFIKLHWWTSFVPSSDWMPLRHIAASLTLPTSQRGRRLSPLTRTLGRIPLEPRSERIVRVGAPAYTRSSSSSFFSFFLSLTTSLQVTSQHQTTQCLPNYPTQDQMRTCLNFIPSRSHRPSFPTPTTFSFHLSLFALGHRPTNSAAATQSYAPRLHLVLVSLLHTNNLLPSLCVLCEDSYPCSLYTDIPATATVRTTRVYIPALLFRVVEEGMAF